MANRPFDREIINPLEKPLADDLNFLQSYHDMSLRFFLGQFFADVAGSGKQNGFLTAGLKVGPNSPTDLSVVIAAGLGFQNDVADVPSAIDGLLGLNDLESYKPLPLFNNHIFTVPTAPANPNSRIDIIEVKADRITTDPTSRQVFNPGAGEFQAGTVNKTLTFALDGRAGTVLAPAASTQPLSYKVGVEGTPGVAPATTAGYIKLAEIFVDSDVVTIEVADITDFRNILTSNAPLDIVGDIIATGDIIAGGDLKHGPRSVAIPAFEGFDSNTPGDWTWANLVNEMSHTGGSSDWLIPIHLPAGTRILSVDVDFFGVASIFPRSWQIRSKSVMGVAGGQVGFVFNNNDVGIAQITVFPTVEYIVPSGEMLFLEHDSPATGDRIGWITVHYDRP